MKFSVGLAAPQVDIFSHDSNALRLKSELFKKRDIQGGIYERSQLSGYDDSKGTGYYLNNILSYSDIQKKINAALASPKNDTLSHDEEKDHNKEKDEKKEATKDINNKEEGKEKPMKHIEESFTKEKAPAKCKVDNLEVESIFQLNEISNCKTFFGNIIIRNMKEPYIEINGIQSIDGSLIIEKSPDLVRVEAQLLQSIGYDFRLKELTSLSLISFPQLTSVHKVDWQVIPMLSQIYLGDKISNVNSITISDTAMTKFSGFVTDELDIFDINNNRYLESIVSDVLVISNRLHFAANADDIEISLPNLQHANNMSIHDVKYLNLSSLTEVHNSVSFIQNYFKELKMPKLEKIGGTLSILRNEKLTEVDFPSTTDVGGGLMIVNNTNIGKIDFLPKLTIIGGAIEFVGNIKEMSFPQLRLVKGSAKIQTQAESFDCTKWSRSSVGSVIRGGKIECTSANNQKIISKTPTDEQDIEYSDETPAEKNIGSESGAPRAFEFTETWLLLLLILFFSI